MSIHVTCSMVIQTLILLSSFVVSTIVVHIFFDSHIVKLAWLVIYCIRCGIKVKDNIFTHPHAFSAPSQLHLNVFHGLSFVLNRLKEKLLNGKVKLNQIYF